MLFSSHPEFEKCRSWRLDCSMLVLQGEKAELWAGRCLALARYSYKRIPAL